MIFTTVNLSYDQLPDGLHALTMRNDDLEWEAKSDTEGKY